LPEGYIEFQNFTRYKNDILPNSNTLFVICYFFTVGPAVIEVNFYAVSPVSADS